jgi:hypothetical protein
VTCRDPHVRMIHSALFPIRGMVLSFRSAATVATGQRLVLRWCQYTRRYSDDTESDKFERTSAAGQLPLSPVSLPLRLALAPSAHRA